MADIFRNLRLNIKVALLGIGSVLITAIALLSLAVWQSGQYNTLAQSEVDALIDADLDHITQGVYNLVRTENEAVQQQVNYNLNVARHILDNTGSVSMSEETIIWTATNQFTNAQKRIQLPRMLIGGNWLGQNINPDVDSAVVDEVTRLVGETATIFQRMNEQGDMIRVATTVKDMAGRRAIGTYIPAFDASGKPNPVTAAILKGKTYHGRAFVVNTWYLTAYEPIKDNAGNLVGMLYVGVKQKAVEMRVRQAILQTTVGKTGYVYVLGGKGEDRGHYIISQRGERDGEDIWENKDSDGRYVIQAIIAKAITLHPGELTTIRYRWQNPGESSPRWKVARLTYYEPWDWVIGTSVYEDELLKYRTVLSGGRTRMTTVMGMAGLTITLLIGLAGIFIAWTIARPVRQLTEAAETISAGNLNHIVDAQSRDEIGLLAQTFNIMTERLRQTMEGLRKSEEKYRTLIETTRDLIFIIDIEGMFTFVNPRVEKLTGFSSYELMGRPFTDILPHEFREAEIDYFTIGIKGEIIHPFEVEIMHKTGGKTPVEFLISLLFDVNGKPVGRFGVGRDMTERKLSEEALRQAYLNLQEFSFIVNKSPAVAFLWRATENWPVEFVSENIDQFGYTPNDLTSGMIPYASIVHPDDRGRVAAEVVRYTEEGHTEFTQEYRILTKSGEVRWTDDRTWVRRDELGMVTHYQGIIIDITARKKAEDALQTSQQQISSQLLFLEALLSAMPIPVFYKDADFRYLGCNTAYVEYMGIEPKELKGKTVYDLWPYDLAEAYDRKDRELFQRREAQTYESHVKDKNGEIRDVIFRKSVFLNNDGSVGGIVGTHFDFTERKRAEESLKISEQRLAAFIDFLPDATLAIDQDKRIIIWNRAIELMTGIPASEMIGKGDYAYTVPFYGVARPQLMDIFWEPEHEISTKYPIFQKEGENLVIEAFCPALYSGKGAFVWAKASPLRDSAGQLIGAIECIRDISERKQAEELLRRSEANYRSVIENIQDVFYRTDDQGNLIMASPSFVTLLRYNSLDDCLGRSIAGTFYYEPEKRTEFLRELQDKESVTGYEVVLKRKDGTPVTVETSSHLYFDDTGNVAGVEGVFRDVSERQQAQDARKQLEDQLLQAQKMEAIGTLAGGIAHDFNNILTGIIGYTELYKDAVLDRPKVYHSMEEVLRAAERARDLVKHILTFGRKTEHDKKPVLLSPIVKEVVKFMRASLPATIEIIETIDVTSDAIMADPSQIHQVLMNLCTNAGYAMKDSGGILEIGLKRVLVGTEDFLPLPLISRHGHYLKLTVRDSGAGIPEDDLGRIFEPYFTTKEKGEGTGLGLAVVHGIVKDHGGEISVYSKESKGTIFSVYLPVMEKHMDDEKDTEADVLPGKGETILFIDDEEMIVDVSREMLERLGYKVFTETDPVKAIEMFKEGPDKFDLVITDKTMPHMTGFDVVRAIKNIRADVPVLICSGYQEIGDMEKLTALGISQLITKPIRISSLSKAIRDALD